MQMGGKTWVRYHYVYYQCIFNSSWNRNRRWPRKLIPCTSCKEPTNFRCRMDLFQKVFFWIFAYFIWFLLVLCNFYLSPWSRPRPIQVMSIVFDDRFRIKATTCISWNWVSSLSWLLCAVSYPIYFIDERHHSQVAGGNFDQSDRDWEPNSRIYDTHRWGWAGPSVFSVRGEYKRKIDWDTCFCASFFHQTWYLFHTQLEGSDQLEWSKKFRTRCHGK